MFVNLKVKSNVDDCGSEIIEFMIPRKKIKRSLLNKIPLERILIEKRGQECQQILRKKTVKGINEKYFKVKEVGMLKCKMQDGE